MFSRIGKTITIAQIVTFEDVPSPRIRMNSGASAIVSMAFRNATHGSRISRTQREAAMKVPIRAPATIASSSPSRWERRRS